MSRKLVSAALFCLLLLFSNLCALAEPMMRADIEQFDAGEGKVTKRFCNTEQIQSEVSQWLTKDVQLAPESKIDVKQGLIFKIPLQPPVQVQKLNITVSELFVIVNTGPQLRMLVLDHNRPFLLILNRDKTSTFFSLLKERPEMHNNPSL
ncbi:hypothetical protein [Effusibacillus dendaii]|uniref:Uncharacterized protein n=1 Tax=Effusibacillus dendaii TaxID=2743772 RepID=A0A7I8DAZ1_9BACL|nr:hypothetical protein [Effusibacillus dendaii]BCJ86512.1 hypothetical protein skT53_14970 [Effusibacillus dendaii]